MRVYWYTMRVGGRLLLCVGLLAALSSSDVLEARDSEGSYSVRIAVPMATTTSQGGTAVPVYSYTVVKAYPHDRDAFTQGLVYDNGVLYEGTGLNGRSDLRRVDLETGEVQQERDLDTQYFGEGITTLGDKVYQITWQSNIGFVYDKLTFEPLTQFSYSTEGWGLTHDGTRLIMSDGTSRIHFLDPDSLQQTGSIDVRDGTTPVENINELEYIQGSIYANIWQTDRIAEISPETGQVTAWIDLTGLLPIADRTPPVDVLNGIAYDEEADRIFVTGKLWPRLFEIDLVKP